MPIYTVTISAEDEIALNNDLLDIDTWIQQAVIGKTANCRKRIIAEWQPILFNDPAVTAIPATQDEFIAAVVARSDYKSAAQRNADAELARPTGG